VRMQKGPAQKYALLVRPPHRAHAAADTSRRDISDFGCLTTSRFRQSRVTVKWNIFP
jgi:hypothetical protein